MLSAQHDGDLGQICSVMIILKGSKRREGKIGGCRAEGSEDMDKKKERKKEE